MMFENKTTLTLTPFDMYALLAVALDQKIFGALCSEVEVICVNKTNTGSFAIDVRPKKEESE